MIWSHMVKCWFHVSGLPVCSSQACCSTSSSLSPSWKTPSWFQRLLGRWNHVTWTLFTSHLLHITHTLSPALVWGEENNWHLPSYPTLLFYLVMLAMVALCKPTWSEYFLWWKMDFTHLYLLFLIYCVEIFYFYIFRTAWITGRLAGLTSFFLQPLKFYTMQE